jgi:UDP-3-O-[3-hydroxymyristoyl] glucosamine N-acyltransferase
MAGQAGIKDKTQIGDKVIVGAQAGVHRNIPSGQQVLGAPAVPVREQRRIFQMVARLPEMCRQFRQLAAQVATINKVLAIEPQADHQPVAEEPSDPTGF